MSLYNAQEGSILILSQGSGETTTDIVMEYLFRMGLSPLRLNGSDLDSQGNFSIVLKTGEAEIDIEEFKVNLHQIQVVWFRRWSERQPFQGINMLSENSPESHDVSQRAAEHLSSELRRISSFLFSELKHAIWLSHPSTASPDKLRTLKLAASVGLSTPHTLVTTSRKRLLQFAHHHPLITKAIGDVDFFQIGFTAHLMYTQELSADLLDALPEKFFPSLFQEKLEKRYELRIFYLAGNCYTSAIFSQSDPKTSIDFRKYNHKKPNRVVPYKLEADMEDKIRHLMDLLELETGSLDLIKTIDGRLVFLEVNPIGQFGMVSSPCNYHLEHRVAEFLAEKINNARPR
ncbi:MAG TPA: grasp-with-spasm system ATP-grasp peptide maturase [Thermoanaerobaculia bacterium]|nr:grasp-with-spasm system ATP-grasp peptide maturase [Thermoanaerobaculia bacterium]